MRNKRALTDKEKEFLLKHRAYKKFMRNAEYLFSEDSLWFISAAFSWKYTVEGYGYWSRLNRLWRKGVL
jgi:hypothetical protein